MLVLAAAGATLAVLWHSGQTHSVKGSSTTEFVPTQAPEIIKPPPAELRTTPWPTYGFDSLRTHFAADSKLRPPYRVLWRYRAGSLVEFPPAVAYGNLYVPVERGLLVVLKAKTGQVVWRRSYRACIAASPAVADGAVFAAMMNPCSEPHDNRPGQVVALDARTGSERWHFRLGATESSPLVVGGLVYVGSRDRNVYAIDSVTGRLRWRFQAGGEVKGGPAYADGTLYVGAYDGYVYALDAKTGRLRWKSGSESRFLGGRGTFYATPTIAYGRIYIGSTDGLVYSFGAISGNLLWARKTGGYVYSSAAVWRGTVFVGSYDHRFYALDASTGEVRWSFDARASISGSPTVMAGVVYFSSFGHRTYGLDALTGKLVWSFPDGEYSPLVADPSRAYLVGRGSIYALVRRS